MKLYNNLKINYEGPGPREIYDSLDYGKKHIILDNNSIQMYDSTHQYSSLLGTITGIFTGNTKPSDISQAMINKMPSGISKQFLRISNDQLSGIVNREFKTQFDAINITNINSEDLIKQQHTPNYILLSSNPPNTDIQNSNGVSGILKSQGSNLISSAINELSLIGNLSLYNINKTVDTGINSINYIYYASKGLKYTRGIGWFDQSMPTWNIDDNGQSISGFITYNKTLPSAFSDNPPFQPELNFSATSEDDKKKNSKIYKLYSKKFLDNPNPINTIYNIKILPRDRVVKTYSDSHIGDINSQGYPQFEPDRSEDEWGNIGGNYTSDKINILDVNEELSATLKNLILLKFEDVSTSNNPIPIIFRAAITSLSDAFAPEWDIIQYVGRALPLYSYSGLARSISITFDVYIESESELKSQWRKLNRLVGMCYPTSYEGSVAMKSPIVTLTLGNVYRGIYGKFDSITVTPKVESLWDSRTDKQLPSVIGVDLGFSVIYEGHHDSKTLPIANTNHYNHVYTNGITDELGLTI